MTETLFASDCIVTLCSNSNSVKINACSKNLTVVVVSVVTADLGSAGCTEECEFVAVTEKFNVSVEDLSLTFFLSEYGSVTEINLFKSCVKFA